MRHPTKAAALAEYAIVAAFVATSTISIVLVFGQSTRLPLCLGEERVSEGVLGEPVITPCQPPEPTQPPPPPPPPPPTTESFAVPSEEVGFLNPLGGLSSVEATVQGAPLLGHPQQAAIVDALCVAMGHLAPGGGLSVLPAENGDARFLTGGRWVWRDDGTGFGWVGDTNLPPYGLGGGTTPIVGTLTCTRALP